jgi:glycosyltransferase involved in cell wall biosynthesis
MTVTSPSIPSDATQTVSMPAPSAGLAPPPALPNAQAAVMADAVTLDVTVILPAYNEEEAIGADLDAVREAMSTTDWRWELLVVDDGSRDGTAAEAERRDWVRVIRHPYNRGVGAARTTGVRAARGRWLAFADADRTYPVDRLPHMLQMMAEGADMVIGARKVEAGTMRWLRQPAKWLIRRLAEFMTGSRIPDLNSGLRVQRRDATLRFLPVLPTTHSWVSTITIAYLANGFLVRWTPIDYFPRVGSSTFHPLRDSYNYLSLAVRTVMYFNPLKIFLPLALFLMTFGTLKYVLWDILLRYGLAWPVPPLAGTTLALLVTGLQILVIGLLADLIVRRTTL